LGHLKPPLSWENHVAAKIERVAAVIAHVVADRAVEKAKVAGPRKFVSLF